MARSIKRDRGIKAKYRPRKKFRKGLGNKGDWNRKRYRGQAQKSNIKGFDDKNLDVVGDIFG